MKTKLTHAQVNVLWRYHCAKHTYMRLVELQAPKVIQLNSLKSLEHWIVGAFLLNALKHYPRLRDSFEARRVRDEAESERKFNCFHHAKYVAPLPTDKKPDHICPFGGSYGSSICLECPHFRQITDQERDTYKWWP